MKSYCLQIMISFFTCECGVTVIWFRILWYHWSLNPSGLVGRDEDWRCCIPVVLLLSGRLVSEWWAGRLLLEPITLLKIHNVAHHGLRNQDKMAYSRKEKINSLGVFLYLGMHITQIVSVACSIPAAALAWKAGFGHGYLCSDHIQDKLL